MFSRETYRRICLKSVGVHLASSKTAVTPLYYTADDSRGSTRNRLTANVRVVVQTVKVCCISRMDVPYASSNAIVRSTYAYLRVHTRLASQLSRQICLSKQADFYHALIDSFLGRAKTRLDALIAVLWVSAFAHTY